MSENKLFVIVIVIVIVIVTFMLMYQQYDYAINVQMALCDPLTINLSPCCDACISLSLYPFMPQ